MEKSIRSELVAAAIATAISSSIFWATTVEFFGSRLSTCSVIYFAFGGLAGYIFPKLMQSVVVGAVVPWFFAGAGAILGDVKGVIFVWWFVMVFVTVAAGGYSGQLARCAYKRWFS